MYSTMQDVYYIEQLDQALTLLHPLRVELLKHLDQPRTCPELAAIFETTPQRVYYHVKSLEKAALVVKTGERRVRGIVEGFYQARARSYWLAPSLVGQIGGEAAARDQTSLRFLLTLAEEVQSDIGRLGQRSEAGADVPSLGLSAHIYLPDEDRRAAFLEDVQTVFQQLARKYGLPPDDSAEAVGRLFRLILACYPKEDDR